MFNWNKKEKPFVSYGGMGGGGTGLVFGGGSSPITASGGTKSTVSRSGYVVHTFTHPSPTSFTPNTSQTFVVTEGKGDLEILVIGGGGGGTHLGAGGAGGAVYNTAVPNIAPGTYPIAIGARGEKGVWGTGKQEGSPGGNSAITNLGLNATAYGGGGGTISSSNSFHGGCGGGGNAGTPGAGAFGLNPATPAPVIASFPLYTPGTTQGYNGGNGSEPTLTGGGGGGAGSIGIDGDGPAPPGRGGNGLPVSITGSAVVYAGGGGGGEYASSGSSKNNGPLNGGGGGSGASGHHAAGDGTPGLGGGGGGAGSTPGAGSPQGGGHGGAGVVIIAYTA